MISFSSARQVARPHTISNRAASSSARKASRHELVMRLHQSLVVVASLWLAVM
jgi:hypothetical protein